MIPAQVTVLDTEASWNTELRVARIRRSRSAQPTPADHDLVPSNHRDRDTRSVRLDELPMQVLLELVRPC
jgi:hypothetical protein